MAESWTNGRRRNVVDRPSSRPARELERALLLLSSRGAQTVTSLAESLSSEASTIDRLCTRLVTRGLLVRVQTAANPKEFVVGLSTGGRRIVEAAIDRRARKRERASNQKFEISTHIAEEKR